MKISVVVPYKNAMQYIKQIEKNFSNLNNNWELIFVDNLSTDNSEIILKTKFPRAIFLSNDTPFSPGISRNIGMKIASGNKIVFCDVDDYINVIEIEKLVENKYDIIIGHTMRVYYDKDGNIVNEKIWKKESLTEKYDITPEMYVDTVVHAKIFDTRFLNSSNVVFPGGMYEDKEFLYNLYKTNPKIKVVEICLYKWNVFENSNSATKKRTRKEIESRLRVIEKISNDASGEILQVIVNNFFNHDHIVYVMDYQNIDKKDRKKIFKFYRSMKKYCPRKLSRRSSVIYWSSFSFTSYNFACRIVSKYFD